METTLTYVLIVVLIVAAAWNLLTAWFDYNGNPNGRGNDD